MRRTEDEAAVAAMLRTRQVHGIAVLEVYGRASSIHCSTLSFIAGAPRLSMSMILSCATQHTDRFVADDGTARDR